MYISIYHSQHRVHSTKLNVDPLTLIPPSFHTHMYAHSRMELKGEANPKPQCNNAQPIFIQPACIKVSCHLTVDLKFICAIMLWMDLIILIETLRFSVTRKKRNVQIII